MAKAIMNRAKLSFSMDSLVKAQALASTNAKTLIVVIGGSSKGLGAAGISADAELERAKALLAEAKKRGMKIIGLHIGGEARRGELSDRFINMAVPQCDYFIVVEEGNGDGLFTKLCGRRYRSILSRKFRRSAGHWRRPLPNSEATVSQEFWLFILMVGVFAAGCFALKWPCPCRCWLPRSRARSPVSPGSGAAPG